MEELELSQLITLNIFTNCCKSAPDTSVMKICVDSFKEQFKIDITNISVNVFIDPNPSPEKYDEYVKNIKEYFNKCNNLNIYKTDGLSYSYIMSIDIAKTPILFQLEHDWQFKKIDFSAEHLTRVMMKYGLPYVKFLRHSSDIPMYDFKNYDGIFITKCAYPNNWPHMISIEEGMRRRPYIKTRAGSSGIEYSILTAGITKDHNYLCQINEENIIHIDGRENTLETVKNNFILLKN